MKFNWKHTAGALALSAAMLSMSATAQVAVKGQSGVINPPVNVAPATTKNKCHGPGCHMQDGSAVTESAKNKSGTIPVENDIANPATEKGIKDPAVKGCGSCGLTGKEAAPPPVDDGAAPGSEQRKFNDQWSGAPPSAEWEDPKGGQHFDKGKPKPPSAAKRKGPKVRDDSVSTKSSLLPVLGGVAALAALAAAVGSGGDDNPTSP